MTFFRISVPAPSTTTVPTATAIPASTKAPSLKYFVSALIEKLSSDWPWSPRSPQRRLLCGLGGLCGQSCRFGLAIEELPHPRVGGRIPQLRRLAGRYDLLHS